MIGYRLNKLIQQGIVEEAVKLPKNPKYEVNKTYWCGYWQQYYKVINTDYEKHGKYEHLKSVIVEWEDGRTGTHCTSLDEKYDYELILK